MDEKNRSSILTSHKAERTRETKASVHPRLRKFMVSLRVK